MNITIAFPTRGCDIYYMLIKFLFRNLKQYKANLLMSPSGYSATDAQDMVIEHMYESKDDYLLFLDSDVCPPMDALDKMLACKKNIVCGPVWHYCSGRTEIYLDCTLHEDIKIRTYKRGTGVERITSSSFGCLLLSRHVFDVFKEAKEDMLRWSPLLDRYWKYRPPDTIFFKKAQALGMQAYVDWSIQGTVHNRVMELGDTSLELFEWNKGRDDIVSTVDTVGMRD